MDDVWNTMLIDEEVETSFIYWGDDEWFCIQCVFFLKDNDVVSATSCPNCGRKVIFLQFDDDECEVDFLIKRS